VSRASRKTEQTTRIRGRPGRPEHLVVARRRGCIGGAMYGRRSYGEPRGNPALAQDANNLRVPHLAGARWRAL
jgi:hypothetical protein